MEILMTIFAGTGMIVIGSIFGAISLIILEHYIEKLVDNYRFWKFTRSLKEIK